MPSIPNSRELGVRLFIVREQTNRQTAGYYFLKVLFIQTDILVSHLCIYSFIIVLSISYVFHKHIALIVVVEDMPSLPMVYIENLLPNFICLAFY